jgi:hypothetical protein
MNRRQQTEKKEPDGDLVPMKFAFPEAARFTVANGSPVALADTVVATIEAAADVAAGETVVETARVAGGRLLVRRQRRTPH